MRKTLFFGIADFAETLYESIMIGKDETHMDILGFVADDFCCRETEFRNHRVYKYSELGNVFKTSEIEILVAVGYSNMNQGRKKIFERLAT